MISRFDTIISQWTILTQRVAKFSSPLIRTDNLALFQADADARITGVSKVDADRSDFVFKAARLVVVHMKIYIYNSTQQRLTTVTRFKKRSSSIGSTRTIRHQS
jgi:hypothetical protein